MHESIEITEEERDGGFTLVELLIVIVILGILAAVTVFAVGGITNRAEQNTCETERATIRTAAEAYIVDNQTSVYPTDPDTLVPEYLRENPSNVFTIDATTGVVSGTCGSATTP